MKLLLLTVFFKLYLKTSAINPSDCGHPLNQNSADRILGGTDAEPGEFPWQSALIRRYTTGNGDTKMDLCGGTYIEQSWVLTAAHCIMISNDPEQYTVFIGVYDDQRTNGHEASVIKLIAHPGFSDTLKKDDIALVKFNMSMITAVHKQPVPVCLSTSEPDLTADCVATGFGETSNNGQSIPILLQKVKEPIIDPSICANLYEDFNSTINVCAGGRPVSGSGTCSGDSGGPLQCRSPNQTWIQVGLTSYGTPVCGMADTPDVFTKVSSYLQWINQTIQSNS